MKEEEGKRKGGGRKEREEVKEGGRVRREERGRGKGKEREGEEGSTFACDSRNCMRCCFWLTNILM